MSKFYTEIIQTIKKDHPLYPKVADGRGVSYERLGDWDKVEKKPRPVKFTRGDEIWEYTKLGLFILLSYLFFHFIIMGWTI